MVFGMLKAELCERSRREEKNTNRSDENPKEEEEGSEVRGERA
jgi:hypothetical protein